MDIYSRYGDAAYDRIDRALEVIRRMPEHAPRYHVDFRRKIVPDTTFGLFYCVVGTRVMVSFVMDLRQNPDHIRDRLNRMR
jgi:hypothetical protein